VLAACIHKELVFPNEKKMISHNQLHFHMFNQCFAFWQACACLVLLKSICPSGKNKQALAQDLRWIKML